MDGSLSSFREDFLRQLLAELDTPLVEAVDVPDHALSKYLVLVARNEAAEILRGDFLEGQDAGGAVAGILPVRRQLRVVGTERQRVRLRDAVRSERFIGIGIYEIDRNDLGPLVQQLVEGVLAQGAFGAPQ